MGNKIACIFGGFMGWGMFFALKDQKKRTSLEDTHEKIGTFSRTQQKTIREHKWMKTIMGIGVSFDGLAKDGNTT